MHRLLLVWLFGLVIAPQQQHALSQSAKSLATAEDRASAEVEKWTNVAMRTYQTEMDRKLGEECAKAQSMAEMGNCASNDGKITEANYERFVRALQASFSVPEPEAHRKIFPSPAKAFMAGELAWKRYRDKTCEAVLDTFDGGTAGPMNEASCLQDLTRQHMKEVKQNFLNQN